MDDLSCWLALLRTPGIGPSTLVQLSQQIPDIPALFDAPELINRFNLPHARKTALENTLKHPDWQAVEQDLTWAEQRDNHILLINQPGYPELLKQTHSPPAILFVKGQIDIVNDIQLAMVGSRNPTADGRDSAWQFARHLADHGMVITSGMALGIDAQSHYGALAADGGRSIAVAGTGLDRIYPARHKELAWQLAERGAIVSEYPLGTGPLKHHFPQRNRIISGLSVGTLVVEAALKSGSLITAYEALEQSREVFAIPGSIHNPLSRGCHQLIKSGAKLVETADDILEELASLIQVPRHSEDASEKLKVSVSPGPVIDPLLPKIQQQLLKHIGYSPRTIDDLIEQTGLDAADIQANLILLEINDYIQTHPGDQVSLKPAHKGGVD